MNKKHLVAAALALAGTLAAGTASAHVSWSIGINLPVFPGVAVGTTVYDAPGYYRQPYAYYPPPPVVYPAPGVYAAPVVYGPPVYARPPVYVPRRGYYGPPPPPLPPPGHWHRGGWRY